MKLKIPLLLFSLLFIFSSFKLTEWITFTSKEGKFSIMLPANPQELKDTVTEGAGSPYSTFLYMVKDVKDIYILGWVDYNPQYNFDNQSEINANRDNFIKSVGATLVESKVITFENHSGIHFTARSDNNNYLWTSKVFISGKRPYMLVLGSPDGKASLNEEKFFSSFKLAE